MKDPQKQKIKELELALQKAQADLDIYKRISIALPNVQSTTAPPTKTTCSFKSFSALATSATTPMFIVLFFKS